jgi:hypothetical protein
MEIIVFLRVLNTICYDPKLSTNCKKFDVQKKYNQLKLLKIAENSPKLGVSTVHDK